MRLRDLASVAIMFVIAGIVLGIGAEILNDILLDVGTATNTANRTISNASEGMLELAGWLPTIGLVIAAGLIIGIIFQSFGGRI